MYSEGKVLKELDDPRVNALTIVNVTDDGYDVVERVSPVSETANPMWVRYDVSHDEIASRVAEGLLEEGSTLSPDEIQSVESLASAHPESVPELEQSLEW